MNLSDLIVNTEQAEAAAIGVPEILTAVREHLRLDVAFVAQFENGRRVYREVDAATPDEDIKVGASNALDDSFCQKIADGRLPQLMTDARENPVAAALPQPQRGPVGAHLSVPLRLSDGTLYGTFCAFSYSPERSLNERDLQMMHVFADLVAHIIERVQKQNRSSLEALHRIETVLAHDELSVVFQPIWEIITAGGQTNRRRLIGLEALSRFAGLPQRSPEVWFQEANVVGLGEVLERHATRRALRCLAAIPAPISLSFNMSPEHVLDGTLASMLENLPLSRLILEITEHTAVLAYQELMQKLKPLRERGLQLAIDDAGAGYASFRHILNLKPDRIKLDISITKNIDADPSRRALAAAFSRFAQEVGTTLIAEGVETRQELATLQSLGVANAQGNYLGAALPLERALALLPQVHDSAATRSAGRN